jgi:hypothetical protein
VTHETRLRYPDEMQEFVAIMGAIALSAALTLPCVNAQTVAPTLMAPQAPAKSSHAPAPAKPAPAARANPCSIYGEGFASVPGSDTCVKIGGYVRSETGVKLGH